MARAQHPLAWTGSLHECVTPWGPAGHRELGWGAADACPPSQKNLRGAQSLQPLGYFPAPSLGQAWCWRSEVVLVDRRMLEENICTTSAGDGSFRAGLIPPQ